MVLLVDNYDSFVYNLWDYIERIGKKCIVLRNDVSWEELTRYDWEAIVLSPGPGTPQQAGNMMNLIAHYAGKKPILGICLGHQAIGLYCGAKLEKAEKPMHGKIDTVHLKPHIFFTDLPPQIQVVRYHSLILKQLPQKLSSIGITAQQEVMAIHEPQLNLYGLQFHPEAHLTQFGLKLLENWFTYSVF
jgi:anthranilate synthase component 2